MENTISTASAIAASFLFSSSEVFAASIEATFIRNNGGGAGYGLAIDSTTGLVYEKDEFNASGNYTDSSIRVFNGVANFVTNSSSGIMNVGKGIVNGYIAANNGYLYGRTTSISLYGGAADAEFSRFDAATGAVLQTITIPGMGGINGNDSFDWGGFSAPALMNDGTQIYIFGGSASTNQFQLSVYDYGFNLIDSFVLNASQFVGFSNPGYAFTIAGNVFFGDAYDSGHISKRLDTSTGIVESVDFTLTGLGEIYMTSTSYDALNDTLYIVDSTGNEYFRVDGASAAFGVPEPSSALLLGIGTFVVAARRRRICEEDRVGPA